MWNDMNTKPYGNGDRYILMAKFAGFGALMFDFEVTQVCNFEKDNEHCLEWAYCDKLHEVH